MKPNLTLANRLHVVVAMICMSVASGGVAQTPPSASDVAQYTGLYQAAHSGNTGLMKRLLSDNVNLESRDSGGRTPLLVAAFASHELIVELLAKRGADMNALDSSAYDIVTIAAVANDLPMLEAALVHGANATNVTSPYDGTALIAAAHLGHYRIVEMLIAAKAPLDHVNNLGWTALIESVVLGNGGPNHLKTAIALVRAGADKSLSDRNGITPLEHAKDRGYTEMVKVLE